MQQNIKYENKKNPEKICKIKKQNKTQNIKYANKQKKM